MRMGAVVLLMIEILHDLIYKSCRNYGSIRIVYTGSCRISIVSSIGLYDRIFRKISRARLQTYEDKGL